MRENGIYKEASKIAQKLIRHGQDSVPLNLLSSLDHIESRLRQARTLALILDYDGTLVRIAPRPQQAWLSLQHRHCLTTLAHCQNTYPGIVSGRALADLRRQVGLDRIYYAGCHGLELALPSGRVKTFCPPGPRRLVAEVARRLRRELRPSSGLLIEDKGASVALHYRQVEPRTAAAARRLFRALVRERPGLRLLAGKKVLEALPQVGCDKGRAIRRILQHLRLRRRCGLLAIYVGDDKTDEAAFREVARHGLAIRVGRAHRTQAKYSVGSVGEVYKFLRWLIRKRS